MEQKPLTIKTSTIWFCIPIIISLILDYKEFLCINKDVKGLYIEKDQDEIVLFDKDCYKRKNVYKY